MVAVFAFTSSHSKARPRYYAGDIMCLSNDKFNIRVSPLDLPTLNRKSENFFFFGGWRIVRLTRHGILALFANRYDEVSGAKYRRLLIFITCLKIPCSLHRIINDSLHCHERRYFLQGITVNSSILLAIHETMSHLPLLRFETAFAVLINISEMCTLNIRLRSLAIKR